MKVFTLYIYTKDLTNTLLRYMLKMYINYFYLLWAKLLFNTMESIDLYNDWIKKKVLPA